MQPYFFPYIGYWQLIKAADIFVVYDDANYIKGGWVNRNNALLNGKPHLFTLNLDQASPFKKINDTKIQNDTGNKEKLLGLLDAAYRKAPFFKTVFPLIEEIISYNEPNLALYLANHIRKIVAFLNIETKIMLSSAIDKNNELKAQDKVIDICEKLATKTYVNAIGGQELYNRDDFKEHGMDLRFIKTKPITYKQYEYDFTPNLSIIDLMMFCNPDELALHLGAYELI